MEDAVSWEMRRAIVSHRRTVCAQPVLTFADQLELRLETLECFRGLDPGVGGKGLSGGGNGGSEYTGEGAKSRTLMAGDVRVEVEVLPLRLGVGLFCPRLNEEGGGARGGVCVSGAVYGCGAEMMTGAGVGAGDVAAVGVERPLRKTLSRAILLCADVLRPMD